MMGVARTSIERRSRCWLVCAARRGGAPRGAMGSLAQMVTRHVFGLKPDVRGNVWYLDEQTVLYLSLIHI